MRIIHDENCRVHIGEGCLEDVAEYAQNCVVLCEKAASEKILPPLFAACPELRQKRLYLLSSTEAEKQTENLLPLWKEWARDNIGRDTAVINIGGGVLCDMGGFAASVYKRGLKFIHIPTTLLAMADASTGGKTAVDLGEIKNLLGSFTKPEAVFIDPVFLKTLPAEERLSGMAEILKMHCIADSAFSLEKAEKIFTDEKALRESLCFAVETKASVCERDFKELNIRKTLNFGHTVGHALESFALRQGRPVRHGEAVAHGMVCELLLSVRLKNFDAATFEAFTRRIIFPRYGKFPYTAEDIPALLAYMEKDKKNHDGNIYPVLLSRWGECDFERDVPQDLLAECLQSYLLMF